MLSSFRKVLLPTVVTLVLLVPISVDAKEMLAQGNIGDYRIYVSNINHVFSNKDVVVVNELVGLAVSVTTVSRDECNAVECFSPAKYHTNFQIIHVNSGSNEHFNLKVEEYPSYGSEYNNFNELWFKPSQEGLYKVIMEFQQIDPPIGHKADTYFFISVVDNNTLATHIGKKFEFQDLAIQGNTISKAEIITESVGIDSIKSVTQSLGNNNEDIFFYAILGASISSVFAFIFVYKKGKLTKKVQNR